MLRPLTIVVLCALLPWSLCTEECNLQPQANRCPEILEFQERKFLRTLEGLDLDACKKQCCESNDCDTVVYEDHECYLFNCEGVPFHESDSCAFSVFMKPGAPHPHSGYRIEGLMLQPRNTEEEKHDEEEQETDDEGQKSNNAVCTLPRVVGMCKAAFPRFYFDSDSGSCQRFIYGGCGANGNNFETQEECERICPGGDRVVEESEAPSEIQMPRSVALKQTEMTEDDFQEQCKAPRVVGPCRAAFPRWFYNDTAGQCQRFIYGGCSGNKNNYETEDHCTFNCAGVKLLPSKKKAPAMMSEDDKAHCALAPDSGPCRAAFTMFYFDADSQTCKTFLYGGCRGNNNRYTSDAECQERCGNLVAEGRGQGRNRWTAAFFLLLTLAAVSFLLLTALIFITLRRNRQLPQRALSIRSDKEELLPDSDSLDSLPLPESPKEA